MATIAQILAQIRTAIFGKDVRESIAQGIEKCYTNVSAGVTTADAAAGRANTAAARSETINQELGDNADDLVIINNNKPALTKEFNKIWIKPDGTEYQVPTWEEFSDLKSAISFINEADPCFIDLTQTTITVGSYLKSDGTIGSNGAFSMTDYIELPPACKAITMNRIITNSAGTTDYVQTYIAFFYDASKNQLGKSYTTEVTTDHLITQFVYPTAKYIRVNLATYHRPQFIALIKNNGLAGYNASIQSSGITDFDDLPYNYIFLLSNGSYSIAHKPYGSWLGEVLTLSHKNDAVSGAFQLALSNTGQMHIRNSWSSVSVWSDWTEIVNDKNGLELVAGLVGKYTGAYTADSQQLDTGIVLKAGESYRIKFLKKPTGNINILAQSYTSVYRQVDWEEEVLFTNESDTNRNLILFNVANQRGDISVNVFTTDSIEFASENVVKKYIVSKNERKADFTSVTECFLALKDDHNPKIVEIWEGDYDLYQEYVDAEVPVYTGSTPSTDYFNYCVWIPENTHVIGKGLVRLMWMPNKTDNPEITWQQCQTVSPVNIAASMTLENVEIYCKNGRYCIHNDTMGLSPYAGAVQRFINVKCYKYPNETDGQGNDFGYSHCTGFGLSRSMLHYYENCEFHNTAVGRAFYGHTNQNYNGSTITESQSGEIVMKDCIADTIAQTCVKLGNTGSTQRQIRTKFSNCYFSGKIVAQDESGDGGTLPNNYDMTFLNCGDVSVHIGYAENIYPPKGYRTNITNI